MSLQMATWIVKTKKGWSHKKPGPVKFPGVVNNVYQCTTVRI